MTQLIIGLGATGLSCVRYLRAQHFSVIAFDTRAHPPRLADCTRLFPEVAAYCVTWPDDLLEKIERVVVSPGVSLQEPIIQAALARQIPVIGDIELFVQVAAAPIVAITGSNGKSTLTTLMGEIIENAGYRAIVCGNIGLPVLEALQQPTPDYYVVELSSFQLDVTQNACAHVAVVINVSPDHMDRYATLADYYASKRHIYDGCRYAVVNADEPEIWRPLSFRSPPVSFTLQKPQHQQWGISAGCVMYGETQIVAINTFPLQQRHNQQNFLAAFAISDFLKISRAHVIHTLQQFKGLAHRCQLVRVVDGVSWFNDSKATNVGAAMASIDSIGATALGRVILLAGGDSKGVDLTPLQNPVKKFVSHVILFGQDADLLQKVLSKCAEIMRVGDLVEAVQCAHHISQSGDIVLLAPACASLDQFANYMARGDAFTKEVSGLGGGGS